MCVGYIIFIDIYALFRIVVHERSLPAMTYAALVSWLTIDKYLTRIGKSFYTQQTYPTLGRGG